jgi:methyl-accepting chemotaxis protein
MTASSPQLENEGLLPDELASTLAPAWDELALTNADLEKIRSLVADAVKQLASGFQSIANEGNQQQRLLLGMLAQVDNRSTRNETIAGFITQSETLVERVADGLDEASQRTVDLARRLAEVDATFGALATLSGSMRDVSKEIQVLSFNATLEAARAGGAGRGFGIVAQAVQHLSKSFQIMTAQIAATVEQARQTLAVTVQLAEAAANVDRNLSHLTREEMQELQARTTALNVTLGASLRDAQSMGEAVDGGVARCLRGLQFDDLVGQICQGAKARMVACQALLHDSDRATSESDHVTEADGIQATALSRFNAVQHRSVQQTSLDAGDVEFF